MQRRITLGEVGGVHVVVVVIAFEASAIWTPHRMLAIPDHMRLCECIIGRCCQPAVSTCSG